MRIWKNVGVWLFVVVGVLSIGLVAQVSYAADAIEGQAEGQLIVNNAPTQLKYAYAVAELDTQTNTEDIKVIISNISLPKKAVENLSERKKLESAGTMKCVEITINAEKRPISVRIRHANMLEGLFGVSTTYELELKTFDGVTAAGRMYCKNELMFFGTTYTFDVTFTAPIHRKAPPPPLAGWQLAALVALGILGLLITIICIVGTWKMFKKAGKPGWGCLIPFYNIYLLLRIAGKPGWWLLLLFIPLVNLYVLVVMAINIAKAFGKGMGFAIGLLFLGVLFYAILGFGDAQYVGV